MRSISTPPMKPIRPVSDFSAAAAPDEERALVLGEAEGDDVRDSSRSSMNPSMRP
jgi:hypothetical protein